MNLKALTFALILGSSSVAMADTRVGFGFRGEVSARWGGGPTVRDHRNPPAPIRPVMVSRPMYGNANQYVDRYEIEQSCSSVTLANSIEFAGADTRTINVGARAGSFTTLELQAVAGTPGIQRIFIQYDDGSEQAFDKLNVTLSRKPLVLHLNEVPRPIKKIVVYAPGYGTAKRDWSDLRDAEGLFRVSAR